MRLHRVGAKHQPSYRIVITPALSPRDGSYLDQVGFYNPRTDPATIRIDSDKAVEWLKKGVQPTDRVVRLLASVRIDPAAVRRGEPIPDEPLPKPVRRVRGKKGEEAPAVETPEVAEGKPAHRTRAKPAAAEAPEVQPVEAVATTPEAELTIDAPAAEAAAGATAEPEAPPEPAAAEPAPEAVVASSEPSAVDDAVEPAGDETPAKPARKRATRKKEDEPPAE